MLRKIPVTTGLILLWALAVIAAVMAEAIWFAQPAVTRGDMASTENHLVQKLQAAAAQRKLGSAALVLLHGGKIVAAGESGNRRRLCAADYRRRRSVAAGLDLLGNRQAHL